MIKTDFFFDFETRSRVDLKKVGAVNYATDPSTEATLLTWCFGRTGEVKAWRYGQSIPDELISVAKNPHLYNMVAQNIGFDFLIWTIPFKKVMPHIVRPPIQSLHDLMALGTHFRIGASLESMAAMTGLPHSKDKEGRRIMLKQCKPNAKGVFPTLTEEEWTSFERYGLMDTRILRDVWYKLPPLPSSERWAWEWTFIRNLRGVRIDEALLAELDSIVKEAMPKLINEFNMCVNFKTTLGSPIKLKEFFKQYYPNIENMQADTVRDMLAATHDVPTNVRRALEIKDLAGSSSIAKIETATDNKYNGRVYGILAYHYTQTKRWAGRGVQIQNFPRPDEKKKDSIAFNMDVTDLASVVRGMRSTLKDPIGFTKNLLRRLWIPDEGKQFYCGDFSRVEPSVLYWLLGLGEIPKKWYEEMASEIYGIPVEQISKDSEERTVGKSANLGCGYGMGWENFRDDTYKKTGIMLSEEMAKKVVHAYRKKNAPIVKFWRDLEFAFKKAVRGEGSVLCNGKIHVLPMQSPWSGVMIRLPSGGYLYYHGAAVKVESYKEEIIEYREGVPYAYPVWKTREVITYKSDWGQGTIGTDYLYGGLLCENVCSATARELMVPAMWNLENAGIEVLGCIHDEIWGQAEAGRADEFKSLMCKNPSWCDMKIDSDLKIGARYLK